MSDAIPLKVLIIDDEGPIRRLLRAGFDPAEIELSEAATGAEGERMVARYRPDVVLLDLGLPDGDGSEVLVRLRTWTDVPVIVLSARGREDEKVTLLDLGADDYLTKPFGVMELAARIRGAARHARRSAAPALEVVVAGELEVDIAAHRVTRGGEEVHLTPLEFRLLTELVRHPDRVLTHRHLLREVWGPAYEEESHYLRVFMRTLRRKLEADPARPRHFTTEPGVGYRFRA